MSFFISDAAAAAAPATAQPPEIGGLIFALVLIGFYFYFFVLPQSKRAKEKKDMIALITKGAEVVTSGGILGKVVDMDDNFVKIEICDNTFIQVQRRSIETMMPKGTYKAITKKVAKV